MLMSILAGNAVFSRGFFRDSGLDFQTRIALGRAAHGASDVGEVLATVARIKGHATWSREWSATAKRVQAAGELSQRNGRSVSAASAFLRAAGYWALVVDGLATAKDSSGLLPAFRAHRSCWDSFVDCSEGAFLRVDVPYEDSTLPGYLLRPDTSDRPRPTLVLTNGSDGAISDLWVCGAAGALARGWNAFVYDGPGQQSLLFERDEPFRPDWEAVLTPVVDALTALPSVDSQRLTAYGISQAGYWLPRALAFEHRFVAAVLDPGVTDVSTSWMQPLSKGMRSQLEAGNRRAFNRNMALGARIPSLGRTLAFRARPYRYDDWFDLYSIVQQYRLTADVAKQITTPCLITDPEDEQFWPGQSKELAALLPARTEVVHFGAQDGANFHCQPMARLLTDQRMFDWLEAQLP
jgi:hypothetical protein